jgi:predicted DNA-binding transcriptional regulator AlpA
VRDREVPSLRDARAVAEALADVLVERGLVLSGGHALPSRVLDAAEVGTLLGRDRRWVYEHAGELGAFRYGDGPKARIGFDLAAVERWKQERQIARRDAPATPRRRRSSARVAARTTLIPYDTGSAAQ